MPLPHLTKREREVVVLASAGKTNRQIAFELGITEGTVDSHWHLIYARIGISGRTTLNKRRWAVHLFQMEGET